MFKSLLLPWKHTKTKVMVPEQTMEDDQILQEQRLSPCTTCGRTFLPRALKKHAPICEKNSQKKRKVFDSLKQRVEGTDLAQFHQKSYLKRQESTPKATDKSKWEENHQKLVDAIRSAKGASRNMPSSKKPQPLTLSSSNERCPFCERQFGPKAFDRHVEWCKEHRSRVQKSPANILLAKERLEARTKYKVPPLSKSKRAVVKEKYSNNAINRTESICSVKSTPCNALAKNPIIKKPKSVLDLGTKTHVKIDKTSSMVALDGAKKNKEVVKSLRAKRFCPREKINSTHVNEIGGITVAPVKLVGFPGKKLVTWRELSENVPEEDAVIVVYENSNVFGKTDKSQKFIEELKEILTDSDDGLKKSSSEFNAPSSSLDSLYSAGINFCVSSSESGERFKSEDITESLSDCDERYKGPFVGEIENISSSDEYFLNVHKNYKGESTFIKDVAFTESEETVKLSPNTHKKKIHSSLSFHGVNKCENESLVKSPCSQIKPNGNESCKSEEAGYVTRDTSRDGIKEKTSFSDGDLIKLSSQEIRVSSDEHFIKLPRDHQHKDWRVENKFVESEETMKLKNPCLIDSLEDCAKTKEISSDVDLVKFSNFCGLEDPKNIDNNLESCSEIFSEDALFEKIARLSSAQLENDLSCSSIDGRFKSEQFIRKNQSTVDPSSESDSFEYIERKSCSSGNIKHKFRSSVLDRRDTNEHKFVDNADKNSTPDESVNDEKKSCSQELSPHFIESSRCSPKENISIYDDCKSKYEDFEDNISVREMTPTSDVNSDDFSKNCNSSFPSSKSLSSVKLEESATNLLHIEETLTNLTISPKKSVESVRSRGDSHLGFTFTNFPKTFCFGKENFGNASEYEVPKKRRKLNATFIVEPKEENVLKNNNCANTCLLPPITRECAKEKRTRTESPTKLPLIEHNNRILNARSKKRSKKKVQIKNDISCVFLSYRSDTVSYDPFASAERQFMELLECDDFKPTTHHSPRPHTVKKQSVKSNPKKSVKSADTVSKKRSSVIDPPSSFQDPDLADDFEMLENLLNDHFNEGGDDFFLNLSKQNKDYLNVINDRKYSDDMSSIDSNLINEHDNLSIPEHFNDYEDTDSTIQNDDDVDVYSLEYDKKIETQARGKNVKNSKTKIKSNSSFELEDSPKFNRGKVDDPTKSKTAKDSNKVAEESVKPEDLFAVDDKMYAEYKIYEEMYLKEKEQKVHSKKQKGKKTIKSYGIDLANEENANQTKISDDSAYGSLNRNTPKPKTAKLSPLQRKRIDSASSSGSDLPTAPVVNQRMSKFCHECGSKYPLTTAKFCVECGVKRLVL